MGYYITRRWTGHPSVILETDGKGNVLSRTEFETGIENPHAQFRQISKNESGNYLVPLMGGNSILEISPEGVVQNEVKPSLGYFSVLKDETDGLYWVACGDRHVLLKINMQTGEVQSKVTSDILSDVCLFFVAGLCSSENGGLYVCNWQGHDKDAVKSASPQLFEMDKSLKVVWSLNDNVNFGMVSDVCIMK